MFNKRRFLAYTQAKLVQDFWIMQNEEFFITLVNVVFQKTIYIDRVYGYTDNPN